MKTVLITGAGGVAGKALTAHLQGKSKLFALPHAQLDIADEKQVRRVIGEKNPEIVFNCAAYTKVDQAEDEPEAARRANVDGARILAHALTERGGKLIHLSTDYVFDGEKKGPYLPDDPVAPLSIYAQTKADGEKAVLGSGGAHLIVRVAWVFASGGRTFLCRLKQLIMQEEFLRVADDREGPCTYAPDLAAGLWKLAQKDARGIHHFTNQGSCSWHSFAEQLLATARKLNLPVKTKRIDRISSTDLPLKALRPNYSVLDLAKTIELLGGPPRHWEETLVDFLSEKG